MMARSSDVKVESVEDGTPSTFRFNKRMIDRLTDKEVKAFMAINYPLFRVVKIVRKS